MTQTQEDNGLTAATDFSGEAPEPRQTASGSTLLEFPGTRNLPQWRKDLSERVREIQQRRAREAALEAEEAMLRGEIEPEALASADADSKEGQTATHLGLVPAPPEAPELNPLVAAALKRIERARQPVASPAPRAGGSGRRGTAAALARVAEERYEPKSKTQPRAESSVAPESVAATEPKKTATDTARAPGLVAVAAEVATKTATLLDETPKAEARMASHVEESKALPTKVEATSAKAEASEAQADRRQPRRVADVVIDDAWLSRLEEKILPPVNATARKPEDIAPLVPRLAAAFIDLFLVAFLSSPFAAIIELTNGNWTDPRVAASMGGIVLTLMFLYLTVSTALAGRTWAMSLFGLHTVDSETAQAPTLGQCVRRTIVYILSLATLGLGIIYALFDAERRTAHDHFSGTVVVRE